MHKQNENVTDGARNRTLLACGNKSGLQCIKKKTHTKATSIQTIDTLIAKAVFGRGCAPDLTGSLRRSPDLLVVWGRHILFPKTYSLPQNVSPICKQELSYRRESRPLRLSVTGRQTTSIHLSINRRFTAITNILPYTYSPLETIASTESSNCSTGNLRCI